MLAFSSQTPGGEARQVSDGQRSRRICEGKCSSRQNPFVSLYRPATPDGFDSVVIGGESRDWWCGEGGSYSLGKCSRPQLAVRISDKDGLVPKYRSNLPPGAQI